MYVCMCTISFHIFMASLPLHLMWIMAGRCALRRFHRGRLQRELPGERGTTAGGHGDPRASKSWGFHGRGGTPIAGWFTENPMKLDDN